MTQNAITFVKMLWNISYTFLTSFVLPGTVGVTPLMLILFATFSVLAVRFLKDLLLPR